MADRRILAYPEDRFFSKTCIFAGWKPHQGTFPDLFPCIGDHENTELDYQLKVIKNKLSALGIPTEEYEM